MSEPGPIIYGLESQGRAQTARTLAPRAGETENIHFLVGTQSLKHGNQIHLLEYCEETGVLDKTVFVHPAGEIWHLSSSPFDSTLLSTCYSAVSDNKVKSSCSLWRLVGDGVSTELSRLDHVADLHLQGNNARCSIWDPSSSPQLVTIDDKKMTLWKMADDRVKSHCSAVLDDRGRSSYSTLSWNPHHNCNLTLCSLDSSIKAWDVRTNKFSFSVDAPHGPCVRGLDFNPNKPHHFVSCGDDCSVKFWDSRKLSSPLAIRQDHSHWVWSAQYNLFHDQLILTASSDSQVILTRMASIASEPLQHLDEDSGEKPSPPKDEVVATYDEHEDSVYSAVWSVADAWVFASLSFDGRVVINHVPTHEKFSILTS